MEMLNELDARIYYDFVKFCCLSYLDSVAADE